MENVNIKKEAQGFTLIELLVVVLIIGILSAVAVPQYQLAVDKARFTELMSLIKHIKNEQELYYLANGQYATDCEELGMDAPSNTKISNKRFVENSNQFSLRCNYHLGSERASGITNRFGGTVAYEMAFDHTEEKGYIVCFAYDSKRGERICNSLCGPTQENDDGSVSCYF